MIEMTHHGKVTKDEGRWKAACDCALEWKFTKWRDAFAVVFYHVRQTRKSQALGVGFGRPR